MTEWLLVMDAIEFHGSKPVMATLRPSVGEQRRVVRWPSPGGFSIIRHHRLASGLVAESYTQPQTDGFSVKAKTITSPMPISLIIHRPRSEIKTTVPSGKVLLDQLWLNDQRPPGGIFFIRFMFHRPDHRLATG
jgi:hypothetical protein